ncbi:hypothetical protein LINPERHAP2_LOCUS37590, partial [Linum perenne]
MKAFDSCRYVKEIYATLLPELLQIGTWNDMVQMIMQKNRVSQLTWCVIIAEVWKGRCTRHFCNRMVD